MRADIGGATAIALALGGVKTLILAARSEERAVETIEAVKLANPSVTILFLSLDLTSLSSVRAAAEQILANPAVPSVDVLINNAGVCYAGDAPRITADGLEEMWAVCHVGHWLLTGLLMPKLLASGGGARVINLTSAAHSWWDGSFEDYNYAQTKWDGNAAYGRAKAANIVFSKGLAAKYGAQGIFGFSVNPGWVLMELSRHWSSEDFARAVEDAAKIGMVYSSTPKSLEQGCATTLVAVLDPGIAQASSNGAYFDDCQEAKTSAMTEDPAAWKALGGPREAPGCEVHVNIVPVLYRCAR
ncbi:NAD(P)-binding protein [Exidia glandulosa HHB12029]|uniref:NAD(P)-binding protein n=1 Tax=Exidia glandulosa HHB12029 TaxID=1314781 RepID=A0A165P027_EXIGL|nr:NAD(P)-binding protein [Exidia glandulosa HHB12029]